MSIDRDFRVGIEADATSAVAATKQVADETARYNDALVRMALQAKAAEAAQRKLDQAQREAASTAKQSAAAAESSRYQEQLERMAQEQALASGKHGRPDDGWFAGVAERRAVMLGALRDQGEAGKAAMTEIAAATDKATGSTKNLKEALSRLAIAFPELGMIGRSMLSPITAAALAVGGAFALVKREIESFNDAIVDVPWEVYHKGAEKASEGVKQVRDLAQEAADASARLMDVFGARQSAEERRDAASKKYELALAGGVQDPARRAAIEADIEDRYARREFEREERGRAFKLQEQERRAAVLLEQGRKLESQLNELKAWQGRIGDANDLKGELEAASKNLEAERAALVTAETKFEEVDARFRYAEEMSKASPEPVMNPFAAERELLSGEVASRTGTVNALIRRRGDLSQRLRDAEMIEGRIGALQPAYENVASSYYGVQGMLPTQRAVAGIESAASREALSMDTQARALSASQDAGQKAEALVQRLTAAIDGDKSIFESMARELEGWRAWKKQMEQRISQHAARNRGFD